MTAMHNVPQPPGDRLRELINQMITETSDDMRERSDPLYLRAIDERLDALLPIADEMAEADEVGEARARGMIQAWMEQDPEKTAALFAAALLRLVRRP